MIIVTGGFSKKSFFIILCRSSRTQLFFKTGVIRNFAIFTGKYLYWSLFLLKLHALRPSALFQLRRKRDFTGDSCENCKMVMNSFFYGTLLVAAFVSLILSS